MLLAAISPATWYNLGLAVVLIALAVGGILAYRAWSGVHEDEETASTEELWQAFEQARAAGELDDEEYARVRQRFEQGGPSRPASPRGGDEGQAQPPT
jgi:hypothetical protein